MKQKWVSDTIFCIVAALAVATAYAQPKFPMKPVTLVVPYPPGGSIGAAVVSNAAPDGYTLCLLSSSFTTNAAIQPNLPFDPVNGFTPVGMVAKGPMLLTVANHVPAKTMLELFDLARKNPASSTMRPRARAAPTISPPSC